VLFNEPKLLKSSARRSVKRTPIRFSALQRAEIAEIVLVIVDEAAFVKSFSALQRAEIAEIYRDLAKLRELESFSALQRAEIAEITRVRSAGCSE